VHAKGLTAPVSKGDVIFRLDSSEQEAALDTAKRKIAEVDAIATADGLSSSLCAQVISSVPLTRSAGILIPEGAGQRSLQAGSGQIEAQVLKEGMVADATCISKRW
jgi:hypothetical protein